LCLARAAFAAGTGAAAFDPVWVKNGRSALARLRYEGADVCVLDLMLPELDGWGVIESARRDGIGVPISIEVDRLRIEPSVVQAFVDGDSHRFEPAEREPVR
jgi:two-component system, OmpR family, response regulator